MANNEDIDFGQMSKALNDKLDRDGRNVNTVSGADVVIEYQLPTAENNYTWYRLYKSGLVEQGGLTGSGSSNTITLLKTMSNTNYSVQSTATGSNTSNCGTKVTIESASQISVYKPSENKTYWEVKGMSAQS